MSRLILQRVVRVLPVGNRIAPLAGSPSLWVILVAVDGRCVVVARVVSHLQRNRNNPTNIGQI